MRPLWVNNEEPNETMYNSKDDNKNGKDLIAVDTTQGVNAVVIHGAGG